MRKELEALERLAMHDELHIKECKKLGIGLTEDYEVVERALLELESIKEANPSESLECLEEIKSYFPFVDLGKGKEYVCEKEFNTIQQALLKAEKDEKIILAIEDYLNQRIKVEPLEDVRKAFIEIRNQLQVIKEALE